jgi:NAD(P)-dependent dehydrogenase (short-subunit alcohol dehydrogenase family)
MRLAGKRALITAAASGMGRAGCELFAAEGATVAALDRDEAALASVVAEVTAKGGEIKGFAVDLTDRAATTQATSSAISWLGGIDALWSHAGMPAPSEIVGLDLEQYQVAADLNLTASVLTSAEAVARMREQGSGGSIVFTSSTSGLVGSYAGPLYSAFKFGVVGLAKGMALRYAPDGIRVNALCPGPVATPMLYNDFLSSDSGMSREENERRMVGGIPLGRAAQPVEVAHAALWLASDDSSYVTGVALPVDGGSTAR